MAGRLLGAFVDTHVNQWVASRPSAAFEAKDIAALAATIVSGWANTQNPLVIITQFDQVDQLAELAVALAVSIARVSEKAVP